MSTMWDTQKNKELLNLEFSDITTKDTKNLPYWNCLYEGRSCTFRKTPKQVYSAIYHGFTICNVCNELPFEKSIMFKSSYRVNKYWDLKKNAEINVFPQYTPPYSNDEIYVYCEEDEWQGKQRCADLIDHIPCPFCNKKSATSDHNLQKSFPEIAKSLHPNFDPNLILPFSKKVYPWWCADCNDYYQKSVSCRTSQNQGCPNHIIYSLTEKLLCAVFNKIIGGFANSILESIRWKSNGNPVEIDMYHDTLLIAIEYDGKHHDTEKRLLSDQEKNNMLVNRKEIKTLIRIREDGLPSLKYDDNNQHYIICGKHEYTYKFLVPAIQEAIYILIHKYNFIIKEYSDEELYSFIYTFLPELSRSDYLSDSTKRKTIENYVPGLLRHISEEYKNLSYGSSKLIKITCPREECRSEDVRTVKKFVKSQGKCKKCLHFVKDIYTKDSPLERWHPQNNRLMS